MDRGVFEYEIIVMKLRKEIVLHESPHYNKDPKGSYIPFVVQNLPAE
jgi:hypothetical protein